MEDRFKFRAWDKNNNEMLLYLTEYYDMQELLKDSDLIIMQCTGLKDKNGKLIYEGDIVKAIHKKQFFPDGTKLKVTWFKPTAHFSFETIGKVEFADKKLKERNVGFSFGTFDCLPGHISIKNIEIIGNIYQDSHLFDKPA